MTRSELFESLPIVSILIPNYNKAPYLRECLNSVLAQTYSNWECIVVDDHSTDESLEILKGFAHLDQRIKVFERPFELVKGGNVCRNYAISLSRGNYCIFLDSDDLLTNFCLAQRLESIISFPENDFWVFKSLLFDKTTSDAVKLWNIETNESDLVRFLRMDALWQTTGPIYRKSFLNKINGFDENLAFWQDYDLHLRAIISGGKYLKLYDLPPDVYIREGDKNSLSRSTPFTADKDVLSKRILFFKNIEEYSFRSTKKFSREESFVCVSILYFFVSQYWIKHGDFFSFLSEWKTICHSHSTNEISYTLGIAYITLIKLAIKYPITQGVKEGFEKFFSFKLLDYYMINNTQLGCVSFSKGEIHLPKFR